MSSTASEAYDFVSDKDQKAIRKVLQVIKNRVEAEGAVDAGTEISLNEAMAQMKILPVINMTGSFKEINRALMAELEDVDKKVLDRVFHKARVEKKEQKTEKDEIKKLKYRSEPKTRAERAKILSQYMLAQLQGVFERSLQLKIKFLVQTAIDEIFKNKANNAVIQGQTENKDGKTESITTAFASPEIEVAVKVMDKFEDCYDEDRIKIVDTARQFAVSVVLMPNKDINYRLVEKKVFGSENNRIAIPEFDENGDYQMDKKGNYIFKDFKNKKYSIGDVIRALIMKKKLLAYEVDSDEAGGGKDRINYRFTSTFTPKQVQQAYVNMAKEAGSLEAFELAGKGPFDFSRIDTTLTGKGEGIVYVKEHKRSTQDDKLERKSKFDVVIAERKMTDGGAKTVGSPVQIQIINPETSLKGYGDRVAQRAMKYALDDYKKPKTVGAVKEMFDSTKMTEYLLPRGFFPVIQGSIAIVSAEYAEQLGLDSRIMIVFDPVARCAVRAKQDKFTMGLIGLSIVDNEDEYEDEEEDEEEEEETEAKDKAGTSPEAKDKAGTSPEAKPFSRHTSPRRTAVKEVYKRIDVKYLDFVTGSLVKKVSLRIKSLPFYEPITQGDFNILEKIAEDRETEDSTSDAAKLARKNFREAQKQRDSVTRIIRKVLRSYLNDMVTDQVKKQNLVKYQLMTRAIKHDLIDSIGEISRMYEYFSESNIEELVIRTSKAEEQAYLKETPLILNIEESPKKKRGKPKKKGKSRSK